MERYDDKGKFLSDRERYRQMREALAGEMIVTACEAFIYFGRAPDEFDEATRRQVERDLDILGYRRRKVAIGTHGVPQERWVRENPWMEDELWQDKADPLRKVIGEMLAKLTGPPTS